MVIDQDGLQEVEKIKNALTHMYDKVDAKGVDVSEEYSFIFKILGQMETDWSHEVTNIPSMPDELTIDGRVYKRS
jgi:hypothetical protein